MNMDYLSNYLFLVFLSHWTYLISKYRILMVIYIINNFICVHSFIHSNLTLIEAYGTNIY